jgi:hypothetical protein
MGKIVQYISIGKMVQKKNPAGGVSCGAWLEVTIMVSTPVSTFVLKYRSKNM